MRPTSITRLQILPLYDSFDDIAFYMGSMRKTCPIGVHTVQIVGTMTSVELKNAFDHSLITNVVVTEVTVVDTVTYTTLVKPFLTPSVGVYAYWEIDGKFTDVFYIKATIDCSTLSWSNLCNNKLGYYGESHINKWQFPIALEREGHTPFVKSLTDNLGIRRDTKRISIKDYSVETPIPTYTLDAFMSIRSSDTVTIDKNGVTYDLQDFRIEIISEGWLTTDVRMTWKIKNEDIIFSQCHSSIFSVAPDDGYGGYRGAAPGSPPTVSIAVAGDILTASGTAGSTYTWTLDGVAFGVPGASITMGPAGSYTVTALLDGQNGQASHIKVDLCALFVVTNDIAEASMVLIVVGNTDPTTYLWEYSVDGVSYATLLTTVNNHVAQNTGYYRYTVTDTNSCEFTSVSYIDLTIIQATIFGIDIITIADNAGDHQLTASITGNLLDPVDITWYEVIGDNLVQIGTGSTIDISTGGFIQVKGESGDLEVFDQIGFALDPTNVIHYERFIGDDVIFEFPMTIMTLVDPSGLSENQINARYTVLRNGIKLKYNASPSDVTHFSIDFANNEIEITSGIPLRIGENIEVIDNN